MRHRVVRNQGMRFGGRMERAAVERRDRGLKDVDERRFIAFMLVRREKRVVWRTEQTLVIGKRPVGAGQVRFEAIGPIEARHSHEFGMARIARAHATFEEFRLVLYHQIKPSAAACRETTMAALSGAGV